MDHRVPRVGVAVSVLLAFGALLTFIFLNQRFEGPDPAGFLRSPYQLQARFDNTKTLPSKQAVLHKGVSVGRVNSVDYDEETQGGIVTFTIDRNALGPVYADARLQIGERSLLGDAYLNLLDPGTPEAGELEAGGEVEGTIDSVNFDEALDFLDAGGRERVRSIVGEVGRGLAPRGNGEGLNHTVGGLSRTVSELELLTQALRGQEEDIAGLVSDSAIVVEELGRRERSLRTIVGSGRVTLDALGSNTASLEQALDELPPLLEAGEATLAEARPLLEEARPLVLRLGRLAPRIAPAFREGAPFAVGPLSADLVEIIEALPAQRRIAERVLPRVRDLNLDLAPVIRGAGLASRNAVPIAGYLAPRINSISAFYANGASVVANSDSVGRYARFGIISDPGLLADVPVDGGCETGAPPPPGSWCYNAYPEPGNARDHQPFTGSYPRLFPYQPPDPESVARRGRR